MRKRRTLKQYATLFRNPFALFGNGPDNRGAAVTLWPNGESEIWIQGANGKGYRITASEGPAGLGLHISTFVGAPAMSVTGNKAGDYETFSGIDARHIELCQYNGDAKSQAFKKWYASDAEARAKGDDIYPLNATAK